MPAETPDDHGQAAGPRIAELAPGDIVDALEVIEQIWGRRDGSRPLDPPLVRAMQLGGCYLAGAWIDRRLVGASVAFAGVVDGEVHLHSHITGILPGARNRGIGLALKRHQRQWCLDRGIPVVSWTFDPLVRRNGWFNLQRLGAVGVRYLPDLYGPMDDELNRGDPTDRMLIEWRLRAPRTEQALAGPLPRPGHDGARHVAVPPDIVALRSADPAAARRWRNRTRALFAEAFADGCQAVGMTEDGSYVLAAPAP